MDVIEAMMSETGEVIYNERKRFVEEFQPIFLDLYRRLAGNVSEEVAMSYVSHGERGDLQSQLRDWRQRVNALLVIHCMEFIRTNWI